MRIFLMPDVQARPGTPTNHLRAAGNYCVAKKPDVIVCIGDFWDMPSLSQFTQKGSMEWEGLRYQDDINSGLESMEAFLGPIRAEQRRLVANHRTRWNPRMVFTIGNHEPHVRCKRFIDSDPRFSGLISGDDCQLEKFGWEVHDFLNIVKIGGIAFSHYFINPHSAKKGPLGGGMDTMLKNCGFSFVQGHKQGLQTGKHFLADGSCRMGIVAGSFYQHDEDYMGHQGNLSHWRGCVMLNEVGNGGADICELSMDYLLRKWS